MADEQNQGGNKAMMEALGAEVIAQLRSQGYIITPPPTSAPAANPEPAHNTSSSVRIVNNALEPYVNQTRLREKQEEAKHPQPVYNQSDAFVAGPVSRRGGAASEEATPEQTQETGGGAWLTEEQWNDNSFVPRGNTIPQEPQRPRGNDRRTQGAEEAPSSGGAWLTEEQWNDNSFVPRGNTIPQEPQRPRGNGRSSQGAEEAPSSGGAWLTEEQWNASNPTAGMISGGYQVQEATEGELGEIPSGGTNHARQRPKAGPSRAGTDDGATSSGGGALRPEDW